MNTSYIDILLTVTMIVYVKLYFAVDDADLEKLSMLYPKYYCDLSILSIHFPNFSAPSRIDNKRFFSSSSRIHQVLIEDLLFPRVFDIPRLNNSVCATVYLENANKSIKCFFHEHPLF